MNRRLKHPSFPGAELRPLTTDKHTARVMVGETCVGWVYRGQKQMSWLTDRDPKRSFKSQREAAMFVLGNGMIRT